jgi:TRAP-type C4-dicarboxylate transport system substrate-binding protein
MNGMPKIAVFVVALALALTACGGGKVGADKAGGDDAPVTLRVGTDDGPGRPAADQIEEFARLVEEVSEGHLRIEPVWHAGGEDVDDWDQVVARMVVSGELDMGMIPARAWDTEGVTSLRALHAPFLVTSDELVEEIVTSDLAKEMLSGLEAADVTGVALLPEGLRHVLAFGDPPLSPADFDGMLIRAPRSDTTYALFEALGALPDDLPGDDQAFLEGVRTGRVGAAESSFALAGTLPGPTTAIGNLTLFPKVNSLVINSDAFGDLTDDQRAILRDAGQRTLDWATGTTPTDADVAREFCKNGGRIVVADEADIEELQGAIQSVYDELEKDEATKRMIERIRELKQEAATPEVSVAPCGAETDDGTTAGDDEAQSAFPEGVYRMEMTAEFLIEAGVDRPTASNHAGIWSLTFQEGQFLEGTCVGTYSVSSGRVTIHLGTDPGCGTAAGLVLFSAGWTLEGDQLRFEDVRSGHGSDLLVETLFGGKPFTKIN